MKKTAGQKNGKASVRTGTYSSRRLVTGDGPGEWMEGGTAPQVGQVGSLAPAPANIAPLLAMKVKQGVGEKGGRAWGST